MLRGFATINYWTDDVGAAKRFVTAAVIDPFGNVLGIMHNPHYLEILAEKR
jgi:hypothetical protein